MLEIGNGMPKNEERAHFSMWCMLAAPLISGNDIRNISNETLNVLCNNEVIAIDQDPLGIQGFKFAVKDSVETWLKPLLNDAWALTLLNRSKTIKNVSIDWEAFMVNDSLFNKNINTLTQKYEIRDVWKKTNIGTTNKSINFAVPSHDVVMLVLTKTQ